MKSGYGIKNDVNASIITNASSSHYSVAQTAVSYFPEFKYKKYWRLLQYTISGKNTSFQFKPNEYSTYNRNVHFLPIWYPDNIDYRLYTYVIDAWTPAGMLSVNLTDVLYINGSVFDDWYTKRE